MKKYSYSMRGKDASDNFWRTSGEIESAAIGGFEESCIKAIQESFQKLTDGKALYGNPGTSCKGPYKILRFHIELEQ